MCLTTTNPTIRTATENIVVYKRLYSGRTAIHYNFKYLLGIMNVQSEPLEAIKNKYISEPYYNVGEGFHSYKKREYKVNNVFVIPKGAEYITGFDNGDVGCPAFVSNKIICVGRIGRIPTWFRLRKYLKQNKSK